MCASFGVALDLIKSEHYSILQATKKSGRNCSKDKLFLQNKVRGVGKANLKDNKQKVLRINLHTLDRNCPLEKGSGHFFYFWR